MKNLIVITILAFAFNYSFGRNVLNGFTDQPVELRFSNDVQSIAPVVPREAQFDEGMTVSEVMDNIQLFAPVIPREAGFNDDASAGTMGISSLYPYIPMTATFEEESVECNSSYGDYLEIMTPSVPAEADFTDN